MIFRNHFARIWASPVLVFLCLMTTVNSATALQIVRDMEIENFLQEIAQPLLSSSGLDVKKNNIYLVLDKSINAFVVPTGEIFVNSGLLEHFYDADMIAGVLAHEISHISLNHILRQKIRMQASKGGYISSVILGTLGSILLTPAVLPAVMAGIAQNNIGVVRDFEKEADHKAVEYLEKNGLSPAGLVKAFRLFESLELKARDNSPLMAEYLRTHPLNENRIMAVETAAKNSLHNNDKYNKNYAEKLALLKIKLAVFEGRYNTGIKQSPFLQNYAGALVALKNKDCKGASLFIAKILDKKANDPYLLELAAENAYLCGNIDKSIEYMLKINTIVDSDIIKLILASAIIQNNKDKYYNLAEKELYLALELRENPEAWRMLAGLYHKQNMLFEYHVAMAEQQKVFGNPNYRNHVEAALKLKDSIQRDFLLNNLELLSINTKKR